MVHKFVDHNFVYQCFKRTQLPIGTPQNSDKIRGEAVWLRLC